MNKIWVCYKSRKRAQEKCMCAADCPNRTARSKVLIQHIRGSSATCDLLICMALSLLQSSLSLLFEVPILAFFARKNCILVNFGVLAAFLLIFYCCEQYRLARRIRDNSPQRPRPRLATGLNAAPRMNNRPSTALPANFKSDGLAVRGGGVARTSCMYARTFCLYTSLAYLDVLLSCHVLRRGRFCFVFVFICQTHTFTPSHLHPFTPSQMSAPLTEPTCRITLVLFV